MGVDETAANTHRVKGSFFTPDADTDNLESASFLFLLLSRQVLSERFVFLCGFLETNGRKEEQRKQGNKMK